MASPQPLTQVAQAAPGSTCPYARLAVAFYRGHFVKHQLARGAPIPTWRKPRNCADARYLANVWAGRSRASRLKTERHLDRVRALTLRERTDWKRAVTEVQRAYPGTHSWLLSCSASEGGWGRWVPNSQGSGVGGWMQMFPSTFWRMFLAAKADVERRGFIVPASAASWYSPLGQALGSAWGYKNGRRGEWMGAGC